MTFLKGFRLPPTLVIIAGVLFLAAVASELLPSGSYQRVRQVIPSPGLNWVSHEVAEGETLSAIVAARRAEQAETLAANSTNDAAHYQALIERLTATQKPRLSGGADLTGDPAVGTKIEIPLLRTRGRDVVRPGTFELQTREEAGDWWAMAKVVLARFLMAPLAGFEKKSDIIGFVLIIGGAFGIILATGAIDSALRLAVRKLEAANAGLLAIPAVMVLFSLAGATFGLSEEVIPFVMITIPLAIRLGYDSLTGLCMSFVAAGMGFAAALTNPFTIGIAQGIAGVAPFSGFEFRLGIWFLVTTVGVVWTMRWAAKVKRNPEISPVYESDKELIHTFESSAHGDQAFDLRQALILLVLAGTVVITGIGATRWDWWLGEITGAFLAAGMLSALIGKISLERAAASFAKGAADLTPAALIIALSAGILVVLEQGQTLDSILNFIDRSLGDMPGVVGANVMYCFHMVLNFFIPSGSGQAAVTMPLMAPLADLMGISRQTAVLAYQFGDGFNNMIIPTSAVTMSVLGIARLPWEKWVRWILPLQLIFISLGIVLLTTAVLLGYE